MTGAFGAPPLADDPSTTAAAPGGIMIIPGGGSLPLLGVAPVDLDLLRKLDGARLGTAMRAASGSFAAGAGLLLMLLLGPGPPEGAPAGAAWGVVGGGPMGFATSAGSSPGKTHTLRFSS